MEIETFLKIPHTEIEDLSKLNETYQQYFISLNDKEKINSIKKELILTYLDGALIIKNNDDFILDFTHWDLVDQLLAYFDNALEELKEAQETSFYFPDQPIKVKLKKENEHLFLSIDKKTHQVNFIEFHGLIKNQITQLESIDTLEDKLERFIDHYSLMVQDFDTSPFEHIDDLMKRDILFEHQGLLTKEQKETVKKYDQILLKNAQMMHRYMSRAYNFKFSSDTPLEQWWWHLDKIARNELTVIL